LDTPARPAGSATPHGLTGKSVLITGASRGLGRGLVERFAEEGANVAFCSRRVGDLESLEKNCRERGWNVLAMPCDVRVENAVVRMVHRVWDRFRRIDIVVNAAAIRGPKLSISEHPLDLWRDVVETNLTGAYLVCREVIPYMTQQKSGVIINVADAAGGSLRPFLGAYAASKAGVEGLSSSLAHELKPSNIRVNVVDPEHTRDLSPGSFADLCLWLASDAAHHVTGQHLKASAPPFAVAAAPTVH